MTCIEFRVRGTPVAKQSYRHAPFTNRRGVRVMGHTDHKVKAWEDLVRVKAKEWMAFGSGMERLPAPVECHLIFFLKTRRKVDCDNLAKPVLDALKGVCFNDDTDVTLLTVTKHLVDGDIQHPEGVKIWVLSTNIGREFFEPR